MGAVAAAVGSRASVLPGVVLVGLLCMVTAGCTCTPSAAGPAHDALPETIQNSLGMKLVLVRPGKFTVEVTGDVRWRSQVVEGNKRLQVADIKKRTQVAEVRQCLYVAETEVTNAQLECFLKYHRRRVRNDPKAVFVDADEHPATYVSWLEADAFCYWLSRKEGKRYRLLYAEEWAYCAHAGQPTVFCWGDSWPPRPDDGSLRYVDSDLHELNTAPDKDGYILTSPVKAFRANRWGLYGFAGNVSEWVLGAFVWPHRPSVSALGVDARLCMGANWTFEVPLMGGYPDRRQFECGYVFPHDATNRKCYVGFRVALEVE